MVDLIKVELVVQLVDYKVVADLVDPLVVVAFAVVNLWLDQVLGTKEFLGDLSFR